MAKIKKAQNGLKRSVVLNTSTEGGRSTVSKIKPDGRTVVRTVDTPKGFARGTKNKTVYDSENNKLSESSKELSYNKTMRKIGKVTKKLNPDNPNDSFKIISEYKKGGKVTKAKPTAQMLKQEKKIKSQTKKK